LLGILFGITENCYYRTSTLNTSTKGVSVKKEEFLNSQRSQNSAYFLVWLFKYNWKDLNLKAICELVAELLSELHVCID
jgi:hypothetical protein